MNPRSITTIFSKVKPQLSGFCFFLAFYLKYLMMKLQATKDISFLSPPLGGQLQEESRTAVEPDG